METRDI